MKNLCKWIQAEADRIGGQVYAMHACGIGSGISEALSLYKGRTAPLHTRIHCTTSTAEIQALTTDGKYKTWLKLWRA